MTDCPHDQALLLRNDGRAPVPDGCHTHVMVIGCVACRRAWPFPPVNFTLTTREYQATVRAVLTLQGYQLESTP